MHTTVDLNSQFEGAAVKVRDVPVNNALWLKLMPPPFLPLA
jgi:hypothetical protein